MPADHHVGRSSSGDLGKALDALQTIKVHPLGDAGNAGRFDFRDISEEATDSTCLRWEDNLEYWRVLHQIIDAEPIVDEFCPMYGLLASLGIRKDEAFARDRDGAYLDGGTGYRLSIPLPVPGKLFWSITVYDAQTRSQVQTDQGKAALRSMFELGDLADSGAADLYFGPTPPADPEQVAWIQTLAARGWFAYIRIYGPERPAFDGTWKPGDFERLA